VNGTSDFLIFEPKPYRASKAKFPRLHRLFFVFLAYAFPTKIRHFYLKIKSGFKERGIQIPIAFPINRTPIVLL
jgi:hypothetical protein